MMLNAKVIENIIDAVREAGRNEIMPRFRKLDAASINSKSAPDDLVTIADENAEKLIASLVRQVLPEADFVGEEASERDPSLMSLIDGSEMAVIIDPVDGTWNYANGLATFGSIIAVTRRGETVFGLLYDPVMDDWIAAEKGSGAWSVTTGDKRVLSCAQPQDILSGYIPFNMFSPDVKKDLFGVLPQFDRVASLRCSCHEYRMLAQGHVGFCIAATLKPWDHAAGALIVEEAGGVARLIDSIPYRPGIFTGTMLTAVSEDVFENVVSILRPVFAKR
ncbi:MAG: inositol monophosphatase family protein [Alphaproteobacteria bacterium]